jgi:hypothetical protein
MAKKNMLKQMYSISFISSFILTSVWITALIISHYFNIPLLEKFVPGAIISHGAYGIQSLICRLLLTRVEQI